MKTKMESALNLLESGYSVIPTRSDKRPYTSRKAYQDRLPTKTEVIDWWTRWPDANPAIITGAVSGVDVIDFDIGHDEWPKNGEALPGIVVETPSGGTHYYFRHIDGLRNSRSKLANKIDVRAEGGYVLAPPSVGVNGNPYKVMAGSLDTVDSGPGWLIEMLQAH